MIGSPVLARLRSSVLGAVLVVAALATSACTADPVATDPTTGDASQPSTPEPGPTQPDPREEALDEQVAAALTTLEAVRDTLAEAEQTEDVVAGRAAAERAVHTLIAAPSLAGDLDGDGSTEGPRGAPLFPGPADTRQETIDYGDAFTELLTAARNAGSAGGPVLDVLRDPVAGDLGTWQRDVEGLLDQIRDTVDRAAGAEMDVAEMTVSELAGEGPRAIAWSLLAVGTDDLGRLHAFAERARVHIEIMHDGLSGLDDGTGVDDGT